MAHKHWTEKYAFPMVLAGIALVFFIYWHQHHEFKAHIAPPVKKK